MATASASSGRRRSALRSDSGGRSGGVGPPRPRSRSGAHAARPRRTWLVPFAAVAAVLLAVATWRLLQGILPESGSTTPGAGSPSAAAVAEGARAQVSIGDTGTMHVVETLAFGSVQSRLDLAVPVRAGAGRQFRPTISSLLVRESGQVTRAHPMRRGDAATVRLSSPSDRVVLEYDAAGVAVRSGDPSNPDRALALVTPLVVREARGLPASVAVQSVKVLNVGCLRGARLSGCGTQTPDGWTVESSGEGPRTDVLAQLNLAVP